MADIAIVTDSTAYIPNELVKKYGIHVCPQVLIWGEQTFEDGVDILPNEFYARLSEASVMPSTSQVTPASFLKTFGELAAQGSQILNILISDKLSGTIPSAIQARGEFPDTKIEIVNSGTIAMALGFSVLAAARAARRGRQPGRVQSSGGESQREYRRGLRCRYAGVSAPRRSYWRGQSIYRHRTEYQAHPGSPRRSGRGYRARAYAQEIHSKAAGYYRRAHRRPEAAAPGCNACQRTR